MTCDEDSKLAIKDNKKQILNNVSENFTGTLQMKKIQSHIAGKIMFKLCSRNHLIKKILFFLVNIECTFTASPRLNSKHIEDFLINHKKFHENFFPIHYMERFKSTKFRTLYSSFRKLECRSMKYNHRC